jgi:hypothetical protein
METQQQQFYDGIKLRGALQIHLLDPDGKILEKRCVENTVVTVGRSWVLGQLESVNNTTQVIGYCAIGSVTTAPTTADTALGGESLRLAIGTFVTTGLTNNPPSWQAQTSFSTAQGNTTLAEVGLFNSSASGTMLAHATFTSFVKATSNTLNISYTISG